MASTETTTDAPTEVERRAAAGDLPPWTRVSEKRRAHMARVADLMSEWAERMRLEEDDRIRWAAAGWLHDALRDADPETLRPLVAPEERDLPGGILHGPAAAVKLEGEASPSVVTAVRYHTLGHPSLDRLGRALYLADFLEPGRSFLPEWRDERRDRVPEDLDAVLLDVVEVRIRRLLDRRMPIRGETAAFWSQIVEEAR